MPRATNTNKATQAGVSATNTNKAVKNGVNGFKNSSRNARSARRQNKSNASTSHSKIRLEPRQYILAIFTLLLVYLIVRVVVYPSYYFDVNTLLTSLSELPTINIASILTWEIAMPSWLSWLGDIIQILSFIAGALANCVIFLVGFLRFLFVA